MLPSLRVAHCLQVSSPGIQNLHCLPLLCEGMLYRTHLWIHSDFISSPGIFVTSLSFTKRFSHTHLWFRSDKFRCSSVTISHCESQPLYVQLYLIASHHSPYPHHLVSLSPPSPLWKDIPSNSLAVLQWLQVQLMLQLRLLPNSLKFNWITVDPHQVFKLVGTQSSPYTFFSVLVLLQWVSALAGGHLL